MKKLNLATKLNFKIVCIVVVLMITITAYQHWLALQEENDKNIKWLIAITDFLVQKSAGVVSSEKFSNSAEIAHGQLMIANEELQSILGDIVVPINIVKYGFYSRAQNSIIAIGPTADTLLLVGLEPDQFGTVYETGQPELIEKKSSLIWHGASVITYVRPIESKGVIIGHAFASINQDAVYGAIWKRTLNTFLGAFIMLLVCVAVFRELFIQLKNDLQLFAEMIVEGRTVSFNSEITEFTPILKYISDQTEKMTRLDRLNIIGEMAASIAHEVRNPMTTVRGLLQLMSKKAEFSKQKDNLELMIDEIDRANSIITEFLSLAKNRAMEFSQINLNDIIRDIYPLLRADALRNNCEIKVDFKDIPTVAVDQNSIRQLILNMVRNGLDAMAGIAGVIEICTRVQAGIVYLSIRDHGSGISPEIKEKLGTPFFTTKEKGTGLGLAICYRIVERHGASLHVESEQGKGTVFTIAFAPGIATSDTKVVQNDRKNNNAVVFTWK
ncbi:two-component system sensor histidine kinase NtrB [Anaerospora hongkongensis]|uniref:two-component system sensor histidine kinase NtrB n=1 Tax=Anaerospora hongkongensis TaxID=244830 RepID=UPI0028A295BE|nr:ATP-binding protein [Anaerospora hongkongensis]